MRALISREAGGPETLRLEQIPDPVAGPGQLAISIKACGVNFPDLLMIQDLYQVKAARPFSPGAEIAGFVSAVGEGVGDFVVGDRVIGRCGVGGMAEGIALDASKCTRIPGTMPFPDAAAFQFAYETSYYALVTRGRLKSDETVLVLGASGGVGVAATQVAKALGARVIAAVSSEEKLAFARIHGADDGLIYPASISQPPDSRELSRALKAAVGAAGADVIVDPVCGALAEPALRCIAERGRYLILGFTAGIAALPMNLPLLKSCDILGINWRTFTMSQPEENHSNRETLLQMYSRGKISPVITATFPLKRGGEAIARLKDRGAMGKIVVTN